MAHSREVGAALEAAKQLEGKGVSCEVINLRTIRPIDRASIIDSVKKDSLHHHGGGRVAPGWDWSRGSCLHLGK